MDKNNSRIVVTRTTYGLYGEPIGEIQIEVDLKDPKYKNQVLNAAKYHQAKKVELGVDKLFDK